MFKVGLIVNPFAGIGGRVGFKGSDGDEIRRKALELGAPKLAATKVEIALDQLSNCQKPFCFFTVSGEMGADLCKAKNLPHQIVYQAHSPSTDGDTREAVKIMQDMKVDLLLFAGGDGTARDVFAACEESQLVLGIPAGVKIHSGVYAISPKAAGELVSELIDGQLMSLMSAEVMDIDEEAFRGGKVKARKYGDMQIPAALHYVQATKSGGHEVEELVLQDIAEYIIEQMQDDTYYVIGSGTTCAVIMEQLGLDNTLLGSDIVYEKDLYRADAVEKDFLELLEKGRKVRFVITVIGGQGHLLGRGNHQLSPSVVKMAGWEHFWVIATKSKLKALNGRPLLVDTGDTCLDESLSGPKKVLTGYSDYVVYPVGIEN